MPSGLEELITGRVEALPRGLREHIYRVQRIALELAHRYEVDEEKVRLGALAHDIARAMKGEDLLLRARELGIGVDPVEERLPLLLHGPVAAEMLKRDHGLQDEDIYDAVYWHSTAHRGLGVPAKVVYLADKLDPHKAGRYPFQGEVSDLARNSLDRAVFEFLNRELVFLLQQGELVHPAAVEARNEQLPLYGRGEGR